MKGFGNFNWGELMDVIGRGLGLLTNAAFDYRRLAVEEFTKYSRRKMTQLASLLAEGVVESHYRRWDRSGSRAQLLDIKKKKLEMDFVS